MKIFYLSVLLSALALSCGDSFEKEFEQMSADYQGWQAKQEALKADYQTMKGEWQRVHEAHQAIEEKRTDSLHITINQQHEGLFLNHEFYFKRHLEQLANAGVLKAQEGEVKLDPTLVRQQYSTLKMTYEQVFRDYEAIKGEMIQMIDEQNGMLNQQ
ncbi:MAG TPA: hypothetical protein PKA00_03440 [Saprospiraceae bacterium]|nr:hypothetical protein [Saprospiraceae bacterium]HMQ81930.1 hypothetical protein [Saprospiraceae bacterium]